MSVHKHHTAVWACADTLHGHERRNAKSRDSGIRNMKHEMIGLEGRHSQCLEGGGT